MCSCSGSGNASGGGGGGLAGMSPYQGPYSLRCRVEVQLMEGAIEFFSLPTQP